MNKDMFLKVADAIEAETAHNEKVRFKMDTWITYSEDSCGTSACIAGFANLISAKEVSSFFLTSPDGYKQVLIKDYYNRGKALMGLTEKEAGYLFVSHIDFVNANRRLVPDALRYMAEKEKVTTWSEAFKYARCVRDKKKKEAA